MNYQPSDGRLSIVSFSHENAGKIIQNLNPNKGHGHDNISIRIPKIYDSTIYRPLEKIFKENFKYWIVSIRTGKRKHCSYL